MIDAAGLRVMKAIADEGSFTSAANALGFTQPAISQMVRRLEQRTGTVLVERYGRQVRLTEAGQVLARHAVGVLAALDAAEEEITAIAGLRAGRVRLQAFPSSSATLVPRTLAILKARHPDITVTFTEAEPPESLAALRDGDCDVAVAFAYEGGDLGRARGGPLPARHRCDVTIPPLGAEGAVLEGSLSRWRWSRRLEPRGSTRSYVFLSLRGYLRSVGPNRSLNSPRSRSPSSTRAAP